METTLQSTHTDTTSLEITFLGTGTSSGVPMIGCHCAVCRSKDSKDKRLRSSILLRVQGKTIIIDTTPDFRQQMLRIENDRLDAVLFTHAHKDHIAGLDDIRAYNYFQKKPMHVFATKATQKELVREFYYAFSEFKYPGIPEILLHSIEAEPFDVEGITVTPIRVWHHKLEVVGFRIGDFTYITDANKIDQPQLELIKGSKVLVLNALRKEKHISHFTLSEALELIEKLQIPEAYLTHISHQMGLHETISGQLPNHVRLAYDGLVLRVPFKGDQAPKTATAF
ncbi:phosphoribosyl 1,2-cyclic phosphate phosphodiesterase [Arachidicoccus rhizosphaerae]|uniref:Phosphoribosyl 1,2-cyclic phosphate phosphodiesterase n=1 Tax=Arachidicoccus rhizosphaerae TaxID=551991 RepID=A0A1H3YGR8_9BACT|nr:MBL fold metallo-hydrolase [Arachidicoccus rhizosphaerae]SEA10311.1 phosphoribosyl 1,2-cyclic phosphate phosphodiesterase [Arachidicoccus rhizosphaerae]